MDTDRIERESLIAAAPERVWEVLTHHGTWVGEGDPSKFGLREGAMIVFEMGEVRMPQLVVSIEPQRYISYRWAPYTVFKGAEPVAGNSTLVEFIISREGDEARLKVIESGFDALELPEDQRRKAQADNGVGWDGALAAVKSQAEQASS